MIDNLPAGWASANLGALIELKYGKALPQPDRTGDGYPVFGSNGVVGAHAHALSRGTTLVIGRKGSVGEINFSATACSPIDTTYFVDDVPGGQFRFWFRALQSLGLGSLNKSTAIPGLSRSDVYPILVPVPPLAEQQRIADKLDTVLGRVDACRDRLARVAQLLKRFRQSVLNAAISGHLTAGWRSLNSAQTVLANLSGRHETSVPSPEGWTLNVPNTWQVLRAQDVVEPDANIVYGIVQPGPKLLRGVPYVQSTDIVGGRIQVGTLSRTSPEIAGEYQRSSIRGGDVLLGIIRATKVAVVPDELAGANISRSVARLRPCRDILPRFLAGC